MGILSSRLAAVLCFALCLPALAQAQPLDPVSVPSALRDWVPWVVANEPTFGCTRMGESLECAFPGALELTIDGNAVRFSLSVTLDRRRLVALPGGEGQWPIEVHEGSQSLAVLSTPESVPSLVLDAGSHRIEGVVRYGRSPESLKVPSEIARVFALAGGVRVALERASEGVVTLRSVASAPDAAQAESDSVTLEIVRRVEDGSPLAIDTQIVARISGRSRAITLGRVLVAGSVPSAVDATLPIQVSPDGDVVVQAQSGTHRIRIRALVASPAQPLAAPSPGAPWPDQEIWLFAPSEMHRQVEVRGVSSIDPQSPTIPEDWRASAAFVVRRGQTFTLAESRRGETEPPPNALTLRRTLWLDFDGHGFTARDALGGELPRAARLDLVDGELGRVVVGGRDQLITMPPGRARASTGPRGFEVRSTAIDATAEMRLDAAPSDLPAVGWSEDVSSLAMTLNLPPGHSLFAATGVDDAAGAWLSRWDVGPLFLVLLIGVVMLRLYGKRAGVVAIATLVLVYHEADAPRFVWLAVLVPAAILLLFKKGTLARVIYVGWAFSAAALAVMLGLFVATQLRYAMHPQLYTEETLGSYESFSAPSAMEDMEGGSGQAAEPEAPMPTEAATVNSRSDFGATGSLGGLARGGSQPAYRQAPPANWIDPNAVVQTGYGIVDWQHARIELSWSGPVAKDHRIHLYVIRPWLQRILAMARAAGLLFLLFVLLRKRPSWPDKSDPDAPSPATAAPVVGAAMLIVATLGIGRAQAQTPAVGPEGVAPPAAVLDELRSRLLAPPACSPRCAQIGDATVSIEGDVLRIALVAHASALAALPLPGPASSFVPETVSVDGAPSNALRAGDGGHLYLRLSPGVHRVELTGSLAGRGSIALSFAERPGRVSVQASGWTSSGVDENGLVRASLELRRQLGATPTDSGSTPGGAAPRGADVPVWVAVERHLDVGVEWIVQTTIRRLSTTSAPAVVRVPALAGEAVLGNEAVLEGRYVVATLAQGVPELTFTSRVTSGRELAFVFEDARVAAADVHRTETWSFVCSPLWHCDFDGVAPYQHAVDGAARPTFAPYPGERLRLRMERLAAAPGTSVTIDGVELSLTPGERASNGTLTLRVRTSVSNTLELTLPSRIEVERVEVDGTRRAVQLRSGKLRIGIVPASQRVTVTLRERSGMSLMTRTPRIGIAGSLVNVDVRVEVPQNRWLLYVSGPSWGPIVLFWGHLLLVLIVALGLGRVGRSPLRTHEWALLGVGLLQLPMPFTLVVAGWFFAVRVQHERKLTGRWFNVAQLALTLYAFVAASTLITAVWVGLTDRPDMQIVGNGSSLSSLHWYQDRASGTLPQASWISVSIWVWKGLMLLWAFWLAWSVVKWAVWAVTPFRELGFFVRTKPLLGAAPMPPFRGPVAPPSAPAPAPAPPAQGPPGGPDEPGDR